MREIKFRAWDGSKLQFVENRTDGALDYYPLRSLLRHNCDFVWMQYTGLKDKNGVEIYEGDVLDYVEINATITRGVVEYFLGGFVIQQVKAEGLSIDLRDKPMGSQVIGNIWETPELLSKEVVQ